MGIFQVSVVQFRDLAFQFIVQVANTFRKWLDALDEIVIHLTVGPGLAWVLAAVDARLVIVQSDARRRIVKFRTCRDDESRQPPNFRCIGFQDPLETWDSAAGDASGATIRRGEGGTSRHVREPAQSCVDFCLTRPEGRNQLATEKPRARH